ncbi:hypothetical protein PtB15_11B230 [Puccinia triticina]|nr:hypothetical protein PtB15_11B230 [Puccinia triticina]
MFGQLKQKIEALVLLDNHSLNSIESCYLPLLQQHKKSSAPLCPPHLPGLCTLHSHRFQSASTSPFCPATSSTTPNPPSSNHHLRQLSWLEYLS